MNTQEQGRREVAQAMNQLRYGASVSRRVPDWDQSTDGFLRDVATWLISFNDVLASVSSTTTDMAAELQTLRSQRKAVRDFLGLTATEGNTTA